MEPHALGELGEHTRRSRRFGLVDLAQVRLDLLPREVLQLVRVLLHVLSAMEVVGHELDFGPLGPGGGVGRGALVDVDEERLEVHIVEAELGVFGEGREQC